MALLATRTFVPPSAPFAELFLRFKGGLLEQRECVFLDGHKLIGARVPVGQLVYFRFPA